MYNIILVVVVVEVFVLLFIFNIVLAYTCVCEYVCVGLKRFYNCVYHYHKIKLDFINPPPPHKYYRRVSKCSLHECFVIYQATIISIQYIICLKNSYLIQPKYLPDFLKLANVNFELFLNISGQVRQYLIYPTNLKINLKLYLVKKGSQDIRVLGHLLEGANGFR